MVTCRLVRHIWPLCAAITMWAVWTTRSDAQTQDDFFDDSRIHDVRLTLSSRDWQSLKAHAQEDTYYPADLTWQGIRVHNVGIRSRGSGTRSSTKPGLRVDTNRYLADQEFLGLKAFVLDNALVDPSLIHESVAMKLFARMGLPTPREAHARLFINDEYVGAYVIVEAIDRAFVSRFFGPAEADIEDGGYLYEYRWTGIYGFQYLGPGLEGYAALFEPHTRETDSMFGLYGPFERLARAINESPPDGLLPDVARLLDVTSLIRLLAIQNFLAELDGFVGQWGMSNFYLYRFRQERPAQLIPWDADHAFSLPTDLSIDYRLDTNALVGRIIAVPELRRLYLDTLLQCAELAMQPIAGDGRGWLEREIDRQAALIDASVRVDPVSQYSFEQFTEAIGALRNFSRTRPAYVRCEVTRAMQSDTMMRCEIATADTSGLRLGGRAAVR